MKDKKIWTASDTVQNEDKGFLASHEYATSLLKLQM